MEEIWKRIEAWLDTHAPEMRDDLLLGATPEEIKTAEESMHIKLPSDVKDSYLIHNGQNTIGAYLIGDWQLLPLKDMLRQWENLRKSSNESADVKGEPHGPVRDDWWNPKWIPFAYDGAGDFYCVDLDPPSEGTVGQVISYWHVDEERERLAQSFQEWLKGYADDLEAGKYKVEEDGLVKDEA